MVADVVEPQRRRMPDQLAEYAVPARRVADPLALDRVDTPGDEAPQLAAVVVEDPDRGVPSAGQLARDAQQLLEHGVDLELRHQPATGLQQRREAGFVERPELHPGIEPSVETRNRSAEPCGGRGATPRRCWGHDVSARLTRKDALMAAHVDEYTSEPATGAGLLPIFAIAVVAATVAICAVVAVPGTITLIVAMAAVIGFGTGIVALLSRLIGPEDH
jgi:hypothetical protein